MAVEYRGVTLKRRLAIADLVRREGEVRVEDLSGRLRVSAVTIRGDLTYLEDEGLLVRRFGKAVAQSLDRQSEAQPFAEAANYREMLLVAADLLGKHPSILAGRGLLPLRLIPHLADIADLRLTVTTLDAAAMARACADYEVYILGGRLEQDGTTMGGSKAIQRLRHELHGAFVFEAEAVDLGNGPSLTVSSVDEANFVAAASAQADRVLALMRSAREGTGDGSGAVKLDGVHDIVFPEAPRPEIVTALARRGFVGRADGPSAALVLSCSVAPAKRSGTTSASKRSGA